MTNYNDGNWHGWNGGECPVHLESVVEFMTIAGDKEEFSAVGLSWVHDDDTETDIIAFRVVKEHKEPREFWLCGHFICDTKEDADDRSSGGSAYMCPVIHVREVIE